LLPVAGSTLLLELPCLLLLLLLLLCQLPALP
jgi:hypothetical protein